MPETALERYNAREAARAAVIDEYVREARLKALDRNKTTECRNESHGDCTGMLDHDHSDCLCTCHDPAWTYWVEWYICPRDGLLAPGSMVSGHYGGLDEAIDDGFAAKPAEATWIRKNWNLGLVEQVTEERWDALGDWDEKTEAEKNALRAVLTGDGRNSA